MNGNNGVHMQPFHLRYYNKPKLPPSPPMKRIDYKKAPKRPVRMNHATKLRKEVNQLAMKEEARPTSIDYQELTAKSLSTMTKPPSIAPNHTKTYQYRYKLGRDIPVISCYFTEHILMYKKPPFAYPRTDICGQFKMRKAVLINEETVAKEDS